VSPSATAVRPQVMSVPGSRCADSARRQVILAARVALFEREPERARRLAQRWLAPGGALVVALDRPGGPLRIWGEGGTRTPSRRAP
jgi:hypothetical protein